MRSPKPKRRRYCVEPLLAELLGQHDRADVRRRRQDVGRRPLARRVRVVVGEHVVGDLEVVGHRRAPVSATTRPSSRAPARVITLLTEPGSNTAVSGQVVAASARPARRPSGTVDGWPWRGSRRCAGPSTIDVPPWAPIRSIWSARARSASYCSARSMVSTRSSPARAAVDDVAAAGDRAAVGSRLDDHAPRARRAARRRTGARGRTARRRRRRRCRGRCGACRRRG